MRGGHPNFIFYSAEGGINETLLIRTDGAKKEKKRAKIPPTPSFLPVFFGLRPIFFGLIYRIFYNAK
jgi:hypothetical protein